MKLLLLAGSGEARRIAAALKKAGTDVVASLAGATRQPADLGVPTRIGGFGGRDGFEAYLRDACIGAVLDATHPFAARITDRTAEVCRERGLPHAVVRRPGWQPQPGDDWRYFEREEEVAGFVPGGATVFLGTGVNGLAGFGNLPPRKVICRRIDAPRNPFPFEGGAYLVGRPPFSVADEKRLFTELGVDWLVVKNSGGAASRTKLDAARELGIKVALQRRPPLPEARVLRSVDEALDWVRGLA